MPDYVTGRCDFPCHEYQQNGRELRYESTFGESKRENIQLKLETTESEFIDFREKRDAKLSAPKLLLPSIQMGIL
jgi:hypothetical protein